METQAQTVEAMRTFQNRSRTERSGRGGRGGRGEIDAYMTAEEIKQAKELAKNAAPWLGKTFHPIRAGVTASVATLFPKGTQVKRDKDVWVSAEVGKPPKKTSFPYTATPAVCTQCSSTTSTDHHPHRRCCLLQCEECKLYGHLQRTCLQQA